MTIILVAKAQHTIRVVSPTLHGGTPQVGGRHTTTVEAKAIATMLENLIQPLRTCVLSP